MMYVDAPNIQIVAQLRNHNRSCEIRRLIDDDGEQGDNISVVCGSAIRHVAFALKGIEIERPDSCSAYLTVNAVNIPALWKISICGGHLVVREQGGVWVRRLAVKNRVSMNSIQYASFSRKLGKPICYNVSITSTIDNGRNSRFRNSTGGFCDKQR